MRRKDPHKQIDWKKARRIRWIKLLLLFPGCFVIPLAIFWVVETAWWKISEFQWERQLKSQGLPTSMSEAIPAPVPPEENFGEIPFLAAFTKVETLSINDTVYIDDEEWSAEREKLEDIEYFSLDSVLEELMKPNVDWSRIDGLELGKKGFAIPVDDFRVGLREDLRNQLNPLLLEMVSAKDRKYAVPPIGPTFQSDQWVGMTEKISHKLMFLINQLAVYHYYLIGDEGNEMESKDIVEVVIQLVRLRASLSYGLYEGDDSFVPLLFIAKDALRKGLWEGSDCRELRDRLREIDFIEMGIDSAPRFWEFTEYVPSRRYVIARSVGESIDIPYLPREEMVLLGGVGLLPPSTFHLHGLCFREAHFKHCYKPLKNRQAEPTPTHLEYSMHSALLKVAYEATFIDDNLAHRIFESQTRFHLIELLLELEERRFAGIDINGAGMTEFPDFFNSGKPLKVLETDQSITIYSVGTDFKDDGGDSELDISITIDKVRENEDKK